MKTKKSLFSIITVSFNSEKTIQNTIESVLNQTYTNIEYIIIDGLSIDSTVAIIKSYEKKFEEKKISFTWISEKDKGIYEAFNKGLRLSRGQWISFLGSDDCYTRNALNVYSTVILKTEKKVDLYYSNVAVINKKGEVIGAINGIWTWLKFRRFMTIAHVGAFHNKEYFSKYGFFNESYKIAGDYELLLRAKEQLKTVKIEERTAKMANGGVSNNQINLAFKETLNAKNKSGGISLLLCNFDYFIAFFKYKTKKILRAIIR
ncbi:MAG: glycosyltransferase family 2 protein [Polaribacter sp.]